MGTSFALAVQRAYPKVVLDAVETNAVHREQVQLRKVFQHVYPTTDLVAAQYDLIVLAIPPAIACDLLSWTTLHAPLTVDLCSVKRPICERAQALELTDKFIPSHPMAGKATGGPNDAEAALFADRPWIFLEAWMPPADLLLFVRSLGAIAMFVPDAGAHDEMVAAVSHGIHLTSLSAMLTSETMRAQWPMLPQLSGPALWDITRLAASPTAFWLDTLLDNRAQVILYLQTLTSQLNRFEQALQACDSEGLQKLLLDAQTARKAWENARQRTDK